MNMPGIDMCLFRTWFIRFTNLIVLIKRRNLFKWRLFFEDSVVLITKEPVVLHVQIMANKKKFNFQNIL